MAQLTRISIMAHKCSRLSLCFKPISVTRLLSSAKTEDQIIHTGQQWESSDYRLARFVDRPKHVNTNFAFNLIAEEPPKPSKSRVVSCDGGGGPTGHPKVYINLDKPGNHSCGYCGLRFYHNHDHH